MAMVYLDEGRNPWQLDGQMGQKLALRVELSTLSQDDG